MEDCRTTDETVKPSTLLEHSLEAHETLFKRVLELIRMKPSSNKMKGIIDAEIASARLELAGAKYMKDMNPEDLVALKECMIECYNVKTM
jgi:hypothetical protein